MFNTLNDSKLFTGYKNKTNFLERLSKVQISDYYIPDELVNDRLGIFKGMKDIFVPDIIDAIKKKYIIPCDFRKANKPTAKVQDMILECRFPKSVYTLQSVNSNGEPCILFDLSCKGKYQTSSSGELVFYSISDDDLYDMALAAYIQYKMITDEFITNAPSFYTKIAELYGLLLAKNIDSYLSISAISEVDHNKLYMLTQVFCMQNMFKVDKETAIKYAMKSKFVVNKDGVHDTSYYINHDTEDIMKNVDNDKVFAIDNFVELLCKEFSYVTPDKFNTGVMIVRWNNMYREGAMYALEHSVSFINTIIYALKGMDLSNNFLIKKQLKLITWNPLKEISSVIKR